MKILRYIAFFIVADISIAVIFSLFLLYNYYTHKLPIWASIIIIFITLKFVFGLFGLLVFYISKISPNYKIVFGTFIVLVIVHLFLGYSYLSETTTKGGKIFIYMIMLALCSIPILRASFFYTQTMKFIEDEKEIKTYEDYMKEYERLKSKI